MQAFAIVIEGNETSENGYKRLVESSEKVGNGFEIQKFDALTPNEVEREMKNYQLNWNWPWDKKQWDEELKVNKIPYATRNKNARIACFLSHYVLWDLSVDGNIPILILEHDAEFIQKFDPAQALQSKYDFIGINDPRGATRKDSTFYKKVQEGKEEILPCPVIDDMKIVQGLAGGSAYIAKPEGAKDLITAVDKYGAWPNDAILSMQVLPDRLGVTKTFYTKVQGLRSTTSS